MTQNKQILFADDDDMVFGLYMKFISRAFTGYDIEGFRNGQSLAGRLEEDVKNVALVVLDNSMPPGLTGSEIIKKYSRIEKFSRIPFILSYGGDESIGREAVENGAFDFIVKNFNSSQFISLLQKALDKYK